MKVYGCPAGGGSRKLDTGGASSFYGGCVGNATTNGYGVLQRNDMGTVAIGLVSDGTSNTIMIGEKAMSLQMAMKGINDCNDNEGWIGNWDNDMLVQGDQTPTPDRSITNLIYGYCGRAMGSPHSSGFNVAMADGSVRSIPYSISTAVLKNLSIRNDGNAIGDY